MKRADLTPPLGKSPAGPCRVVERLYRSNLPAGPRSELLRLIEEDAELTPGQTAVFYSREMERGTYPFDSISLTPHAQYRMDLRGVSVSDLRAALKGFVSQVLVWQRDPRNPAYRARLEEIRREKFTWEDPATGLAVVFAAGRSALDIVTVWWKGRETPAYPPGGCRVAAPAADLAGVQTFVTQNSAQGIPTFPDSRSRLPGEAPRSDRDRAAPQAPDSRSNLELHPPGNGSYSVPGPRSDGSRVPVRTPGTPGEEYGHPYKTNPAQRRTMAEFFLERYPNTGGSLGKPSPMNPVDPHPDRFRTDRAPGHPLDTGYVYDNPGSTRVIPRNRDFVNHAASAQRVAARMAEIVKGLDPDIQRKGRSLRPSAPKASAGGARVFRVPGDSGKTYVVTVEGWVEGAGPGEWDLRVNCTCDFWQWRGPEHWALKGDYLAGEPRGDASSPDKRDPKGRNRVCKHVSAVLSGLR